MIQPGTPDIRHTIPRWNGLNISMALGEMDSSIISPQKGLQNNTYNLEILLSEWENNKSLPLAIEIISESKFEESNLDISDVIHFVKNLQYDGLELPTLVREFVFENLEPDTIIPFNYCDRIKEIKIELAQFPRNPLMWNELAREYIISGQVNKSKKAMQVALGLAPNNRTIVRSAVRLYIHIGDFEKAKYCLDTCNRITTDPWILASEIALMNEMGRTSRRIKNGQNMLSNQNFSPLSLSELASELCTIDFSAGNYKQGKRKLQIVQSHLHENAFAQIVWLNKNMCDLVSIISNAPSPSCNYEAVAQSFYFVKSWDKALNATGEWLEYQPFSKEPSLLSSFIAADLVGDLQKAKEAILCGMRSNPTDKSIINNYIYISILLNDIKTANLYMERALNQFDVANDVLLTATQGLLFYRTGHPDMGMSKYKEAMEIASKQNDDFLQCKAAIYLAREESLIGHDISYWLKYINGYSKQTFFEDCVSLLESFGLSS